MDIVRFAISKPVSVTVGVILVVMFGLIGLTAIPIQLTPTVDRPIINVTTTWPGRSPQEVVDEIAKNQEEELKNVSGLRRMKSVSRQGSCEIELEFYIGTDVARANQEVSDSLRQVSDYPEEVEEPLIKVADGASENAIAWIIVDVDPEVVDQFPTFDVSWLYDRLDKEVKPELERIDGVAEVNIYGGREREVRVYVDSFALAQRQLNHADVVRALRQENTNVSAGTIAEGKRDYRIRLIGQYETPEQVLETIVAYREGAPVFVKDIAEVEVGYEKKRGFVRSMGHPSVAMNVIRQNGANVMDVMEGVRERLDIIRAEVLPTIAPAGHEAVNPHLRIRQVYDETIYIDSAISLVTSNLFIGGAIAGVVLMFFLRSFTSTGIIAVAIPISVIGTFLILLAMGRTLNVISLAGLAFAVGMVVDNAIVVLENIYRRIQAGDPPMKAAYLGGREVWGAILASSLTTAAVFIPVLTIQEEAGQLFRDISLAVVAAVTLSLVVSITVIPAACSRWLRAKRTHKTLLGKWWSGLFGLDRFFGWILDAGERALKWLMTGWRGWTLRPGIIITMTAASLGGAALLAPPLDYLPAGNRNLVFGGMLIPPGLAVDQMTTMAERIEEQVGPYLGVDPDNEQAMANLQPIARFGRDEQGNPIEPFDPVPIDNFFIGAFNGGMFVGGTSAVEETVIPVGQLLTNSMMGMPDSFGGARQTSLFGRGVGGGNTVDLEISGPNLARVTEAAVNMYNTGGNLFGFGQGVTADPGNFNLQQQEFRVRLTDRGRELGVRNTEVGVVVRALFDGAFAGEYKLGGENVDLTVVPKGGRLEYKEQLAEIPIYLPSGRIAPLDTFVDLAPALAPQDIQRIEELPAVTLRFQPPDGTTVDEMMTRIENEVVQPARDAGLIDRSMRITLEGTAAKLDEVRTALFGNVADRDRPAPAQLALYSVAAIVGVAGLGVFIYTLIKAIRQRKSAFAYGAIGALGIALAVGTPLLLFGWQPELALARMMWALAVTYLLMAALFESFVYPFVIMFSVPLAVVGGFAGLAIVHQWSLADPTKAPQQLDVLTMLGFVILIGVVVNNAILVVDGALARIRSGLLLADAIALSVRRRIRPIFMSALTSLVGLLPLVLFPGSGSELYRGVGAIVLGGLALSTVLTIYLVPSMFAALWRMRGVK